MASTKTDLRANYRIAEEETELPEEYTKLAPPRASQWKRVMRSQTITISLQLLGALAAAGAGTARPLMAIFYGHLINLYNNNGAKDAAKLKHDINDRVLMLLFLFIGQLVLVCIYGILFSVAAMRYTMRMRALYLKAVVSQDIEQVSESSAATDLSINASVIEEALAEKLGTIIQAASAVVTAMIVSFRFSARLAGSLVVMMVVLLAKDIIMTIVGTKLEKRIQIVEVEATTLAEECISGIRTVTAFGATSRFARRYVDILNKAKKIAYLKSPLSASHESVSYFCTLCAYAMAFWYGGMLLDRGQIKSGGDILIVVIALNGGLNALRQLLPLYSFVSKARAAHATLSSIINAPARLDPFSKPGEPLNALYSRIEFHDVEFAYPSRPDVKVFKKLSMTFGAGKITAVIGPSGCGKSSLVSLLERFYDVSVGCIQINGMNIEKYNVKSLRSNVRVVQQDAALFNDTIFNNITHGLIGSPYNDLSEREKRRLVTNVCKQIQVHEFISQLPAGYETIVGNRGSLLSGGQRQRVAIARAIISNPVILIFDEATSALDAESERLVQAAIDKVSRGRTTIVIAHNLATVRSADRIVLMNEGTVTDEGTHESLLRTSEAYVNNWKAQNLVTEEDWMGNRKSSSDTHTTLSLATGTEKARDISEKEALTQYTPDPIIDMTKDTALSFPQSIKFAVMGSKELRYLCCLLLPVCTIAAAVFPTQAILYGHNLVSFQKHGNDLTQAVNFWALMFFILALVALVAYFALGSLSCLSGTISEHIHRERYFRGLISQPMAFFDKTSNTPGFLITCLSSHPFYVQNFVIILSSLTVTIINLSSVSILGLIVSWRFALVAICGALPVISIAGFFRMKAQAMRNTSMSGPLTDSAQYAAEVIGNMRTVSAFAMEAEVCSMMARKMNRSLRLFYKNVVIAMPLFAFSHSGNLLGMTFSFWYAGKLLTEQKLSPLALWIVYIGIVTGADATSEFFARASSITFARSSCGNISRITSTTKDRRPSHERDMNEKQGSNSISLENVSFAYPNLPSNSILHDVSLHVPQGQHIAIVGPSGSGKSTIISLLERFYQPSCGELRIGDIPFSETDVDAYRNRVSIVSQDTQLFDGTVRDNILLGVPEGDESEELMIKAAREANIHDFISSLPEGYNTATGKKGALFSGGQRQRLAIARALVRNPSILLLDEATSALDSGSEEEVKKALRDASAGRTTIVVAHRLSTIRDADCIYVLVKGRIVESGTHEQLTQETGVYWGMCQRNEKTYSSEQLY